MSPVIRECEDKGMDYFVVHTGQHYDYEMDKIFFRELNLAPKMINLNIGSGTHGETTARALVGIEKILMKKKPDIVLVQGDTNTVLAGSLASVKLHVKLGHVEAGLRSYDRNQPEEYNRIVADHLSDFLFAPTNHAKNILIKEGIPKERIFMTGNTIVDSVFQNLKISEKKSAILDKLNLEKNKYFLLTAHREENVDVKKRLLRILMGLEKISQRYNLPIVYPIHPRTSKKIREFNLEGELSKIKSLRLIDPTGYLELLVLGSNAKLIITDSGGIQEEGCIMKIPCVVLRDKTDRPESIEVGSAVLSGCDPERILKMTGLMLKRKRRWKNPFGDGKSGKKIIKILNKTLS